jgi:hypothetical protein
MINDDDINLRLTTHEAVCAERWRETIMRIKRVEALMVGSAAGIIGLLSAIALRIN